MRDAGIQDGRTERGAGFIGKRVRLNPCRPEGWCDFETELPFPDFEVGFVTFGGSWSSEGYHCEAFWASWRPLGPRLAGLGVALGVHVGSQGRPLRTFGAQAVPKTASPD